ncbi:MULTISPECIES: virulence RhuM family protein [Pasteurellaceae]|uniref:Virulence RhuM family protein n=1 Tax=Pasteurella atlantica TaxID=2827233 RepID=A0AAW8CPM6_9PAST|nr:virulence RhuM family protein [Pasteurella atlantica]MBR0573565.1 virulence RhuM family protein [Pasteurella atlantica]MDP8039575.1 virulence RhuM family protein [Pasteurella atlantica]MDP8041666.1 virulence RhuM family protein [Pasteurella atlantica]MDP8043802.1 virulence RhuM family protein [Pasteurella atlantica]MDP8045887.1 virulence RhuM family protein [Pasteurella atlantica]
MTTTVANNFNNFLLYTAPNGTVKVDVILQDETVWLTQKAMANLFNVDVRTINHHLNNIYKSSELDEKATIQYFRIVQKEGNRQVTRDIAHYNLDAIISVGYRVNSVEATQFRIWATKTLKEYLLKGFVIDDARLKQGEQFGKDYFRELLERVRSIRASERRIYQQITDIFAECCIDYNPKSTTTRHFYATVQNKFHYAIHGQTAAELIYKKADANKEFMGLQTWKNAPTGRILKSDSVIAKNYLSPNEIKRLERTISAFFDYIERIIETRNTFTMKAFAESVNKFLDFNEYKILADNGKVSTEQAREKAFTEYDKFNKMQRIVSDFDRLLESVQKKKK